MKTPSHWVRAKITREKATLTWTNRVAAECSPTTDFQVVGITMISSYFVLPREIIIPTCLPRVLHFLCLSHR